MKINKDNINTIVRAMSEHPETLDEEAQNAAVLFATININEQAYNNVFVRLSEGKDYTVEDFKNLLITNMWAALSALLTVGVSYDSILESFKNIDEKMKKENLNGTILDTVFGEEA